MSSGINRLLFVAVAAFVYATLWLFADNMLLQFLSEKSASLAPWSDDVLRATDAPFFLLVVSLLIQGGVYAFLCADLPMSTVKNRSRFRQFFLGLLPFVCAHILFLAFFNNFFIYLAVMPVYLALLALFAFAMQWLETALRLQPSAPPFVALRFLPVAAASIWYLTLMMIKVLFVVNILGDDAATFQDDFLLYSPQFNEAFSFFNSLERNDFYFFIIANGLVGMGMNYFYARAYATDELGATARVFLFSTLFSVLAAGELIFYFGFGGHGSFALFFAGIAVNFLLALLFFAFLELFDPTDSTAGIGVGGSGGTFLGSLD